MAVNLIFIMEVHIDAEEVVVCFWVYLPTSGESSENQKFLHIHVSILCNPTSEKYCFQCSHFCLQPKRQTSCNETITEIQDSKFPFIKKVTSLTNKTTDTSNYQWKGEICNKKKELLRLTVQQETPRCFLLLRLQ